MDTVGDGGDDDDRVRERESRRRGVPGRELEGLKEEERGREK